jgi:hypothetical protein
VRAAIECHHHPLGGCGSPGDFPHFLSALHQRFQLRFGLLCGPSERQLAELVSLE